MPINQFVKAAAFTLLAGSAATAMAGPQCTEADKSKWQDQEAFQEKLKNDGYDIKKFKVTGGDCYEIYGYNTEGKRVEIYFNPVDGSVVKEEIED